MEMSKVRVKVPASTANLGPGFDTLGMALQLYGWIEMEEADKTEIHLLGEQMTGLPDTKSNLVYKVAQKVFQEAGVLVPELKISMCSDIPLTRGLGSSASAIVGGMVAANALIGNVLPQDQLFQIATALEKHPDNVGASLFGGIVVAFWDGNRAEYIRIEPDPNLEVLVAIPHFLLPTEKARHALPEQYSREDTVFNVSHSSLLVAALCTGNLSMIRHAMKDRMHQPYRSALVPGMEQILSEADRHGALGVALSGAGPTILAFVDRQSGRKTELERYMIETLHRHGIAADTMWLNPAGTGAEIIEIGSGSLMDILRGEVRS